MNSDRMMHVRIAHVLRDLHSDIIEHVYNAVCSLEPGWPMPTGDADEILIRMNRINNLRTAAAWHVRRPTANERLGHLNNELQRLYRRATGTSSQHRHQTFYTRLHDMIWLERDKQWKTFIHEQETASASADQDTASDSDEEDILLPWSDIQDRLNLSDHEWNTWLPDVRLALAQTLLDTLVALYETRPLQKQLHKELEKQHEGAWQWL